MSGGNVLVGVRQSGEGHRGGTLTLRTNRTTDTMDPAVSYDSTSWSILRMTGDGLVEFNQASGLAGTHLVPDLAVALPSPSSGGKTYTFQLRPGIRYSNGEPVKASDVRSTLERDFRLGTPVPYYYDGIVGGAACEKAPKHCNLSRGIVTDDDARTVTFHLVAPDPDFLYKLALPPAYLVPPGTPANDAGVPGTGPYTVETYRPRSVIKLARNPHFGEWSRAAQPDGYPDEIVFRIGGTTEASIDDVLGGKADVFSTSHSQTPPSASRVAALRTRYASQVHSSPQPNTVALFLNTRIPPFNRPEVRRALNYAADRAAAIRAAGGPDLAQATCQVLPPGFPGYRPYCPYTVGASADGRWTAPDLARANALISASGTRGMKVTVWSWNPLSGIGGYAVKLLRSLGFKVSIESHDTDTYWSKVGDSRTRAQIGTVEWISDYTTPYGFVGGRSHVRLLLTEEPGELEQRAVLRPRNRSADRASREPAGHGPGRRPQALGEHRQAARRSGAVGPVGEPEVRRHRLEAGRQLPEQPLDRRVDRPALGALTPRAGRAGARSGEAMPRPYEKYVSSWL